MQLPPLFTPPKAGAESAEASGVPEYEEFLDEKTVCIVFWIETCCLTKMLKLPWHYDDDDV